MSTPPLSALSDPVSLAKLQILVIPVQPGNRDTSARLSDTVYTHWSDIIKRHQSIRGDEIRPSSSTTSSHNRGSTSSGRTRFLPASSATSVSRANTNQHVQLAFPSHPPARHLYPLNLLRLASFPLVVIGITVDSGEGTEATPKGYRLTEKDEDGDIGEGSTPTISNKGNGTGGPGQRETFERAVAGLFPQDSAFPLIKRLVVVPQDLPRSPNPNTSPRKGGFKDTKPSKGKGREEVRYAPTEQGEAWIGGLLGEVVGDVLGELGDLVTALETPAGLKTLSSTLLPSLTSTLSQSQYSEVFPIRTTTPYDMPSRSGSTTPGISHSQSTDTLTLSSAMGINRALTPGGRPTSVQPSSIAPTPSPVPPEAKPAASNPTRRFSAIPSPFARTPSASATNSVATGGAQSPAVATKFTSAVLTGVAGGRLMKILGDVHLLIGMYVDAIKCYDDGAERCRVTGDVLWEAMAREGRAVAGIGEAWETRDGSDRSQPFSSSPIPVEIVAHYLSALSCLARGPLPYPPTILSPTPQSISGTLTLPPPPSTPSSTHIGTGEGLLAYLYTSLSLRIAHFHMIIWSAGGWGSIALSCLVSHTFPRTFPPPLDSTALQDTYARTRRHRFFSLLGIRSGMTRISIFGHGESAVGPFHRAMTKMEQMAVHTEVVWLAKWLDLPRHEAIYGREVVRRLGGIVVEGRAESRRMARAGFSHSVNGAGQGESSASAQIGLGLGITAPKKDVVVRRRESSEGNTAIMTLIERIVSILNIELISPLPSATTLDPSTHTSGAKVHDDDDSKPPRQRFGWPEIQVDTLQSFVLVAEGLADQEMLIRLALSALKGLGGYLHQGSQAHLVRLTTAAMGTMKRRGRWRGGVEWWIPGKMVLSLEVAALPANRFPVEHSASEIVVKGKKDPFLYNPRLQVIGPGKTVIVANEQIDVFITLTNPFAFDLDVSDLSLLTSGVPFLANPLPLILPANSVQTVRLTGISPSPGRLYIQGVTLRLPDGASTEVYLPVIDDKAREAKEKRRSRTVGDMGKMKRIGMEARFRVHRDVSSEDDQERDTGKEVEGQGYQLQDGERWLECKVVRELPLLWVKKTNLAHGTVMLYNGETTTIRLTLENSSSTPVNFLKLSFDDNALRDSKLLLLEELSPRDVYEVEWDMIKRPVFCHDASDVVEVNIPPGGRYTVSVKCLGKVGCTDGSIRIDYGYIDHSATKDGKDSSFHTRQITFPVLFTVYHTLELHDLDIIPFPSTSSDRSDLPTESGKNLTEDEKLRWALRSEADGDHCLVALIVRNVYGVPFEVSLTRLPESLGDGEARPEDSLISKRLVPPGASERIFIPFPRLSLSTESTSLPIPTLTSRQYIKDQSGRTPLQIQKDRESFWYRETLLSRLNITWSEPGSTSQSQGMRRGGMISMRNQDLGSGMMDVLRVEQVSVKVNIGGNVKAGEFVDIHVEVENRLEHQLRCEIRLEPISPAEKPTLVNHRYSQSIASAPLPRHVIIDGVLSATLSPLSKGDKGSHSVSAIFLAEGNFAFRAVVLELPVVDDRGKEVGQGRIWTSETASVQVS